MQKIAMVVDDSRVARMTLKKLLLAAEFEVVEFGSGEGAIEHLSSSATKPDIIFMDVMMDGMDGLTATRQIKSNPQLTAIPIVICTGNDTPADHANALDAGAITALSKPPMADALSAILRDINSVPVAVAEHPQEESHFDEDKLVAKVIAQIEQEILSKVPPALSSSDIETVCRQIVTAETEQLVANKIHAELTKTVTNLSEQLTSKTQEISEKVSKAIDHDAVLNAATQAVQLVIDEADITGQVSLFLADKGEDWLTNQEEELGSQLNLQLERLIPTMVNQTLDDTLESAISKIVTKRLDSERANHVPDITNETIETMIEVALEQNTHSVVKPIIDTTISEQKLVESGDVEKLNGKISTLRGMTVILGLAVVGLAVKLFM